MTTHTRPIVTTIREKGAMPCGIAAGEDATPGAARVQLDSCEPLSEQTVIGAQVSTPEQYTVRGGEADVALFDCGVKGSIISAITEQNADVHVLPHDTDPATVAEIDPDLLFVSNGPGDPKIYDAVGALVEAFVDDVPVAGTCLDQQIVAGALGGETAKMSFDHRGVNQPVRDLDTDRVVMTTQNHGYTVADPGPL